jgi:hypothetical protein
MKLRAGSLRWLGWAAALIAMLLPASAALAQEDNSMPPGTGGALALAAGMVVFIWIFMLACYVYFSLAFQTIATKTNTPNGWWAWIPILNIILMLNIAKKPIWWIILMLIPLVNIVVGIIVLMGVAEARNKPSWWGILMIVPVVGLIVPGYLAWSD